jgi:DNA-binding MarR family transcriptional regulator
MSGRLQRELKMTKPFASPEVEAFVALVRTADQLSRRIAAVLRQHELTMAQYNVLRILRGAGAAGLPCSEVGARLVTWDPDITRLIDRLERRGLVSRARSVDDRRVVLVAITRAGSALLAQQHVDDHVARAHHDDLGHLPREHITQLIETLETVRARLDER